MRLRANVRALLLVFSLSVLLLAAALAGYATYLKQSAEHLRDDLAGLLEKNASFEDVQQLATKYRRFSRPGEFAATSANSRFIFDRGEACTPRKCVVEFEIGNDLLARLRLVNRSRFVAAIVVLDDRIAYLSMALHGGSTTPSAGEVEYIACCNPLSNFFHLEQAYSIPTPIGKPYLLVRVSDSAAGELRRRAFDIDMHCLMSKGGCDWACDYMPLAWKDYATRISEEQWALWKREGMNCSR